MKDYIVFLTSGETINGTMDDDEAERLKEDFKAKTPGVQEYADTEGVFLIDHQNVIGLAINDTFDKNEIGFSTETP